MQAGSLACIPCRPHDTSLPLPTNPPVHLANRGRRRSRGSRQRRQRAVQQRRLAASRCLSDVGDGHVVQLRGQLGVAAACCLVHLDLRGAKQRAGMRGRWHAVSAAEWGDSTARAMPALQRRRGTTQRDAAASRQLCAQVSCLAGSSWGASRTCSAAVRLSARRSRKACLGMPFFVPDVSVSTSMATCQDGAKAATELVTAERRVG